MSATPEITPPSPPAPGQVPTPGNDPIGPDIPPIGPGPGGMPPAVM